MSKKKSKKSAKAAEVTNIFNITIEGAGSGRCAVFDEDLIGEDFMDQDFPDDCECDGDCEHCEYYDDDEDRIPLYVLFARFRKTDIIFHHTFCPSGELFDYEEKEHTVSDIAQEISNISHTSNIMAYVVLVADEMVERFEEDYDYPDEGYSHNEYISILTGFTEESVIEVMTAERIIRKMISNARAEAGLTDDIDDEDEPF